MQSIETESAVSSGGQGKYKTEVCFPWQREFFSLNQT